MVGVGVGDGVGVGVGDGVAVGKVTSFKTKGKYKLGSAGYGYG